MKKSLIFMLLAVAVSGVFALGGAKTANASSVFDEAYQTVKLPHQWNATNYGGQNQTYTCASAINDFLLTETNWSSFIHDRLAGQGVTEQQMDIIQSSFNLAVDSPYGIWGFNMTKESSGNLKDLMTIFWSRGYDGVAPSLIWQETAPPDSTQRVRLDDGVNNSASSLGLRYIRIRCNGSQFETPRIIGNMVAPSTGIITLSNNVISYGNPNSGDDLLWGYTKNGFLSVPDGFNFNYPAGYEGEPIRDSFVPPPTILSDTPAIQLVSLGNFKFEFYDNNFVNSQVNEPPFYCGLGAYPDVIWQIINDDAAIIMSGHFRADKKDEFQHVPSQLDETYTLYATYDCPDDPQIEFDTGVQIPYSTSSNGWLSAPTWNTCIVDGFPWVDVQECLNNLTRVIDTLSFGTMRVNNPDAWVVSEVCYNTTTLHTWLGSDNTFQLCPQFSEQVRNIVTPFVTFLLGLLTITFITRRTGGGFSDG